MNIAHFSIKHKVSVLLAVIMITIFGATFGTQLQAALLPDLELPMAVVVCYYNGASPEDIESLITRPLETAIMSVSGVEEISSSSADSTATIQISYAEGTDLDMAATKLREQFDLLSLPDGAMDPIIMNLNLSELMPTAMIALVGDDLADLQTLAEDTVSPALERIDDVASVTISGGVTEQISVQINTAAAAGYGLSSSYISQILAAENLLYPGGSMDNGDKTLTVSTDAKLTSVEDVANVILPLPTGGTIRLKEVAQVEMETLASDAIAKVDGDACVILQVSKRSGGNEVEASNDIVKRMDELKTDNPNLVYAIPYLASDYVNMSVNNAFENIFSGVILAAIVVFLFLRKLGATAAIAVSMPVCILTVFILMYALDLTLNMMSLGGIALGVGMIVDNSIVVLENIYRFAADGKSRLESCVEGTREVTSSVVASTLTTEAVFIPLGLSGGLAGMIFKDFCLTIASLLGASLLISLTLVPLLCYFMLDEERIQRQKEKQAQKKPGRISAFFITLGEKCNALYLKVLNYFVHHLKIGMLVSFGLVAAFVFSLAGLDMALIPDMDQGQISISVSMPMGSELDETAVIADRITDIVEENCPECKQMYYIAGDESVTFAVALVDKTERERSTFQIAESLKPHFEDFAGCEINCTSSSTISMGAGSDINVQLTGDDFGTLEMIADDLMTQIYALGDVAELKTSLARQIDEVKVTVKREAASQYGLTAATIGMAVRAELTGSTATAVTIDNQEIDMVIKGTGDASKSLDALRSTAISTPTGAVIPLSSVAEVNIEQAPQSISRYNQNRQITVSGSTISGSSSAISAKIQQLLDDYTLPEGYTAEIAGDYAELMDTFKDLGLALIVALGLVYFVLAAQFESFLMPVIVMLILPVSFTGALFALPATGRLLTMVSYVAIIILAGTVVNSSIILIEYIKIRREMGESREKAILNACPRRVRPVLMTALTTILAMIPMSLGMGNSNEMHSDMGVVMIFGMVISTVVTLIFTPVYYSVIDDFGAKFSRKKGSSARNAPQQ